MDNHFRNVSWHLEFLPFCSFVRVERTSGADSTIGTSLWWSRWMSGPSSSCRSSSPSSSSSSSSSASSSSHAQAVGGHSLLSRPHAPSDSEYDYLLKLLLIGDSGEMTREWEWEKVEVIRKAPAALGVHLILLNFQLWERVLFFFVLLTTLSLQLTCPRSASISKFDFFILQKKSIPPSLCLLFSSDEVI